MAQGAAMLKGYLICFFLVLLWVLIQIVAFRLFSIRKKFFFFTAVYLLLLPVYVWIFKMTPANFYFLPVKLAQTPEWLGMINGFILFLLLYCTYAEFFFYIDRPLTFRILIRMLQQKGGTLFTESNLRSLYPMDDILKPRLESMVANGYLKIEGENCFLTDKGKKFAGLFIFFRNLFKLSHYLD